MSAAGEGMSGGSVDMGLFSAIIRPEQVQGEAGFKARAETVNETSE